MRRLALGWLELGRRVGARGDVAGAGAALLGRWAEPHRGYHGLAHLGEVLARVDQLQGAARDPDAVRLAAWFHDAVYDPRALDNEERSAEVATVALRGLDVDPGLVEDVGRLVRVTATHEVAGDDPDGAVLCDADLAVLAAGAPQYTAYVDGVRQEYRHLDDASFARGRAAVLRQLLDRPALFHTVLGRERWEADARTNVTAELAALDASG